MNFSFLFSKCVFFGHVDPVKVIRGKTFYFQCPRCHQDLGEPLKRQKLKVKKQPKVKVISLAQGSRRA